MDNLLIILLALIDNPVTYDELVKKLENELGDECPWSDPIEENDFLHDLHDLVKDTDYVEINDKRQFVLTKKGIKVLKHSKVLNFIHNKQRWIIKLSLGKRI